jgi:sugar lactone lactonase YvrE
MRNTRSACGLAAIAVVALALPAGLARAAAAASEHRSDTVRVVASFGPARGQNPENLVVARDGTVYVTWLFAHSVVAIRPDGSQSVVPLPAGEASGIAIDPGQPGRLTVALISQDPATAGIWAIPVGAFGGHGTPARSVALPAGAFPNGIAYAADGTLYVADSARGLILTIAPGASSAATWLSSDLLEPTGATFSGVPLPGVNGLKVHDGQLYATNTARGLLMRIPIRAGAPGDPVIVRTGLPFDDFAIDSRGVVTAALNISNQVVRFTPAGPVLVIADKVHDRVENPSAVAFGPHHELFITSSAYFGSHPALQVIEQGAGPVQEMAAEQ